jgi:1-deoxy-D-xylulose-5-phosphate reductoisomerase
VDLVLSGVVGAAGLKALLSALQMGRTVALANKESLIMAGELVTRTAKEHGAAILPVDSEHSAMFQCIQGQSGNAIHKIILTASGGPFYGVRGDLSKVTVEKALAHPNWVMGKKITIDSATLMNKGLETIEAHHLFSVPFEKIQIVIHRQSIVHSAVEFEDGSVIAQLSHPDMCLPIQYALTYPERRPCPVRRLDFSRMKRLDFASPDFRKFPCLELALGAGRAGGTMPAVLSASNEVAVGSFLEQKIRFTDIARVVDKTIAGHKKIPNPCLDDILESDRWARRKAEEIVARIRTHK